MTTQTDSKLKVLFIGCGNIAGGFDAARPAEASPLTHAGAYIQHGAFTLAACVDPDRQKQQAFARHWNVEETFDSTDSLVDRGGQYDVISICSPTDNHAAHLEFSLAMHPALVFCEKPLTPGMAETKIWVERFEEAGIPLAVNHTRRWAPDVCALAAELQAGKWGKVRSAVGHYNKGILNNGSHMLDLLSLLLGPATLEWAGVAVNDYWDNDPTIPAVLSTLNGVVIHLNAAHAADYAIFELTIVTERGVICMEDGGHQWRIRQAADSARFAGYKTLDASSIKVGSYDLAMTHAIDNIHKTVTKNAKLACNGRHALEAQQFCDTIRRASDSRHSALSTNKGDFS